MQHGILLETQQKLICKRSIPLTDMSMFELVLHLEEQGWTCKFVGKKGARQLRREPYVYGVSPLIWYVTAKSGDVARRYLLALATCRDPASPVPHFGDASAYRAINGEAHKPPRKRRRVLQLFGVDEVLLLKLLCR